MKNEITSEEINDIIIEKPYRFEIDGRLFFLYNETLGKKMFALPYVKRLEIDFSQVNENPYLECMRLIEKKDEDVCRLIAIHTLNDRESLFDKNKLQEITEFLMNHADVDDKIALLIILFTRERKLEEIKKFLKIDIDERRRESLVKVKNDKNSYKVGGCSVYGTLLDVACERYKWTLDYVLWGISYNNLRMMLTDAQSSIYLTEEERKHVTISNDNTVIDADDPANFSRIMAEFSK